MPAVTGVDFVRNKIPVDADGQPGFRQASEQTELSKIPDIPGVTILHVISPSPFFVES